jgi:nicotinate dehydrogenase subunit B
MTHLDEADRKALGIANRRQFLVGTGALMVSFSWSASTMSTFAEDGAKEKTLAADEVDAFLAIDDKGTVTVYSGKVDLGTGVRTAMTQIVAEELDVPISRVTVVQGDTALTPDQGPTYGSLSIQNGGVQLRQAAATARHALTREAATQLDAAPADLTIVEGVISTANGKQVSYAELVGGKPFALKLDKEAPSKDPKAFKVVGTSVARLDIPPKVTGQFTYMQDVRVPGMLHGRAVRPPAIGATLQSVDEDSVRNLPGFVKVVREGNFLGVIAETEWAAIKAARQLKASWSAWEGLPDENQLWNHVRATRTSKEEISNLGDVAPALDAGAKRLRATYDFTIHTHGSIGPSCAIAELKDGKLTCWTASQATHNLRKQLAAMLGMPVDAVRAIYVDGSGCYGRNGHEDAAADAALLARAVGRPVRVQWMREEEHGWDPKGPPTLIDLEAALDANGGVIAWSSKFFIPESVVGNVALLAAQHAGLPHESTMSAGSIQQNSAIPYAFPNVRVALHRLAETPFRPSWIRTPGRMQNTFANESFMDELAAAAGVDPLEFRLRYLKDPRGVELLTRLARLAGWEKRNTGSKATQGDPASGRGLSYVRYELARTYVGAVADVEVDRSSGAIRVTRFFVVQDCGQIINPDGVRAQLEGNIIQTVSRTLKERVTFDRSRVTSVDWASYPILTFPEVPEIHMDLIDRSTEKPWGAGEPSAAVVSAAISNAVYDAIGIRLRSVPFTSDKVKAAIRV